MIESKLKYLRQHSALPSRQLKELASAAVMRLYPRLPNVRSTI